MFDADADDAVNYGGIGTVIAHEITHGFDDQGRRFDAAGRSATGGPTRTSSTSPRWPTGSSTQFDAYVAVDDVHVNGRLTLGENIADLGGVALAQRAHARVSADVAADRRAHPGAAVLPRRRPPLWRGNTSEELKRTLAQVDPHSPRQLRVTRTVLEPGRLPGGLRPRRRRADDAAAGGPHRDLVSRLP